MKKIENHSRIWESFLIKFWYKPCLYVGFPKNKFDENPTKNIIFNYLYVMYYLWTTLIWIKGNNI